MLIIFFFTLYVKISYIRVTCAQNASSLWFEDRFQMTDKHVNNYNLPYRPQMIHLCELIFQFSYETLTGDTITHAIEIGKAILFQLDL